MGEAEEMARGEWEAEALLKGRVRASKEWGHMTSLDFDQRGFLWRTAAGKRVPLAKVGDAHLQNILRMLQRLCEGGQRNFARDLVLRLVQEVARRQQLKEEDPLPKPKKVPKSRGKKAAFDPLAGAHKLPLPDRALSLHQAAQNARHLVTTAKLGLQYAEVVLGELQLAGSVDQLAQCVKALKMIANSPANLTGADYMRGVAKAALKRIGEG